MRPWDAWWRTIVEGQGSFLSRWTFGPVLATLACPYDWALQLRLQAYHRGWLPVRRLPCRVISVGNLTLGGTGKTPMVEAIARLLQREGLRVGILSRGYGGHMREAITVVSDGERCLVSSDCAGDEPMLLAEHLPGVPVVVGRDRYASGMHAVKSFGVSVIVLDDGFQHVQLARDLDILLLDAARPFGNGRLFPRGELREHPAAITRSQVIVLTHCDPTCVRPIAALQDLRPTPPIFHSQHEAIDLRVLDAGRSLPLSSLNGQRVLAFCGIGTPEHFRRTLEQLGAEVVTCIAYPDHHPFTRSDVAEMVQRAKQFGGGTLVTTEKDGVRLRTCRPLPVPVWELRIDTTMLTRESAWRTCLLGALKD